MEEYITRSEFERYVEQIREEMKQLKEQHQTEEMKAINVNVGSQDVLDHLGKLDEKLDRIDKKQDEQAKGLFMHSKNISAFQTRFDKIEATMATKEDLKAMATKEDLAAFATKAELATLKTGQDAHFDQIEAEQRTQHEMLRQILRLLGQNPGK